MRTRTDDRPCTGHLDTRVTRRHHALPPHVPRPLAYLLLACVFSYGMLGTTLPTPLYVVYLLFLVVALLLVAALPETVKAPDHVLDLRPRVAVPPSTRTIFVEAAVTAVCVFALLGLFSALAPSFLRSTLHEPNLIVAGVVVFLLF